MGYGNAMAAEAEKMYDAGYGAYPLYAIRHDLR